jgi:hypothetical protein
MAVTLTSTAYSATPKVIHEGVFAVGFSYTSPSTSLSASAAAVTILGPRFQNGTIILGVFGSHNSGAATFPMDIGIDSSLSCLASQKAAGSNAINALVNSVPYTVSCSEDSFATFKLTGAPSSDTAAATFNYIIYCTRAPL